jgi:hypothetical protein
MVMDNEFGDVNMVDYYDHLDTIVEDIDNVDWFHDDKLDDLKKLNHLFIYYQYYKKKINTIGYES